MERQPHNEERPEQRVEREPIDGDPYIVLEGGLITNEPALPIIDLDLTEVSALTRDDLEEAARLAATARAFGRDDLAERFDAFIEESSGVIEDEETDRAIRQAIEAGIATAEGAGMEVTTDTAQYMAHGLARLLGRQDSALERFARSGDGDYLELREEYLELYADPMIPGHAKEWINWLGTYLVRRENDQPASGEEAGDGTR